MELGLREGVDFDFFRAQKEAHLAGLPSDVADKGFWSYVRFSFSRWYGVEKVESPLFSKAVYGRIPAHRFIDSMVINRKNCEHLVYPSSSRSFSILILRVHGFGELNFQMKLAP